MQKKMKSGDSSNARKGGTNLTRYIKLEIVKYFDVYLRACAYDKDFITNKP